MAHSRSPGSYLNDYAQLNTIPALVGISFAVASLLQFGGLASVNLLWLDYQLVTTHAMMVSLASLAIAFASSETKDLGNYEDWEKALIAASPAVIVAQQYLPEFATIVANNDPVAGVLCWGISVAGWGVAVK